MKRCPECRRDYYDDSLLYCLDDGATLLDGPMGTEPATAILHETASPGEAATRTLQTARRINASTKNLIIAGVMVTALVTALGVGGYFYYGGGASRQIESIAVMPFANESGDSDLEYLSDGMTDALIRSLSQMPNLSVKARSTVFRYKGKEADPKALGRELGVQAVLTGRMTKRADQITLGLELINIGDESVIWTDQYNRKLADLVTLQSEIGRDVSSKLKMKLSGAEVAKLNKQHTTDPVAYQLYMKGRYEAGKFTEDGYNKGIDYFNQAIARDPNFALAYDGLSYCYYSSWYIPAKVGSEKAKAAARRALELDPDLGEAQASLATVAAWFDKDWETADQGFRKAIELNPNYGLAHTYYGVMLA
jgi:TolB-like protein